MPNTYHTSLATKCHLLKNMTWPSREKSHERALCLKTLGEYSAALHADFCHSKDKDTYPVPHVDNIIRKRCEFQNAVATTQSQNEGIVESVTV